MTAAVNPERVLKDLRELWEQLGKEQETGVLRACAMTLIVIAEDDEDAEQARHTLGVLMHDHPSRAIVLKAAEDSETSARVFAECWMPFGRNQQICSEGIEMTADAANLGEVARLLLPLIVPDLPVVLWARGARFFSTRYFDPLFPLAHKIVVDSETARNSRGAIAVLRELHARGERIADLAWTRLTGWRQAIANVFDDTPLELAGARVGYTGAASTRVLYFSRWLERSAPGVRVEMEQVAGEIPGIRSVTLSGKNGLVTMAISGAGLLEVATGGRTSRQILPPADLDSIMRAELSITGADAVFESVLR
ncbi:MAG TPA: glucose-6-phosphate dehydrogenase assembly protein OpcA [Bryobacteraceae bacterium]|nr:glucose-6-phosphate dehydrogenase assembly protein OpcA [Bryobacteraceae bacterium]